MRTRRPLAAIALLAGLAGCATVTVPPVEMHAAAPVQQVAPVKPPATGAIFQSTTHRPLFEDRRARAVGDVVTISINETTQASKASGTNASRSSTSPRLWA